jgi:DNA polymerase III subunit delta'
MFDLPHPRESAWLHGHAKALAEFRASQASGKLHHAWILGGEEGIGKATFAYQIIYELLSGTREKSENYGVFSKLKAQSHPNLLVLERPEETTATGLNKTIAVDTVRKIHGFFGNTSGEPGMRICLADSLDDLNNNGLNALLKMVEEPPRDALFIMISHRPDRIMPTIRSRSRLLKMASLTKQEMAHVFDDLKLDAVPESGSVRNVLMRNTPSAREVISLIDGYFTKPDPANLTLLAEKTGGKEPHLLDLMLERVENHLLSQMKNGGNAALLYAAWQKIMEEAGKTKGLNLDRKVFTYSVFNKLAN